jgi:hypothetical protein
LGSGLELRDPLLDEFGKTVLAEAEFFKRYAAQWGERREPAAS